MDERTDLSVQLQDRTGLNVTPREAEAIYSMVRSGRWKDIVEVVRAVGGLETERIMLAATPVTHEEYVRTHGMVKGIDLFRVRAEEIASVWDDLLTEGEENNA